MSLWAASVWINEQQAGALQQDDLGYIEFVPDQQWLMAADRPVLGHWFEQRPGRRQRGARPGDLPPFFDNLLPEGDLGLLLRDRLRVADDDDLGLLTLVGEDLPGAVVVRAQADEGAPPRPLYPRPASATSPDAPEWRFSLAGVQLKFSMLREGGRFYFPGRNDRGDWIAKIALQDFSGLCVNEFVTMEWARRAGFNVPACELCKLCDLIDLPHDGDPDAPVYVVQRYDRDGARRIHQEDMMQVLGYPNRPSTRKYNDATYDQLAQLLVGIAGPGAFDEMLRRIVFVVASGNNDAHLKNWSLLYPDGIAATLTPLYDQTFAGQWPTLDHNLALKLGGMKAFAAIEEGRLREFARRAGQDPERAAQLAESTIARIADAWTTLRAEVEVPEAYRVPLRRHWASVPVLAPHALQIA